MLPFVAGVLGDFTGQPEEPLAKLKERKFVNVDKDNFDDVLKGMKPRLQMQADNRLKDDGSKIGVELKFKSLDDFSPERVVNQIRSEEHTSELQYLMRNSYTVFCLKKKKQH